MAPKWRLSRAQLAKNLRRNFLAGLLVIVPLAATALILKWLFGAIDGILEPVVELIFGRPIPGIGFAAILILVYLAGVIAGNFFGRRAVRYGESLVDKVPAVREIYNTSKQVVESLMLPQRGGFKEVVLVEFPRAGMKAIGFVTNRVTDGSGQELLAVFIPTAPIPTSGFLQIIPPDRVTRTNISIEEAMKMVVSGGIVSPEAIDFGAMEQGTT